MNKEAMNGSVAGMKEYFERSTRLLAESDSTFAPKPGVFTVAQQVAHVAQTIDWFINGAFAPGGFDMDFERMERGVRECASLDKARKWFQQACAGVNQAIESHSEAEWAAQLPAGPIMGGHPRYAIFSSLVDHTAHHRGALTVYTRLLGKVPPMPYMES